MVAPEVARTHLTPGLAICRVLNGLWQVSGAHGVIDPEAAVAAMFRYHDAGFTTWDLADHYGPAEDFVGEFRRRLRNQRGEAALDSVQAFTKWVPNPGRMTRPIVEAAINRSLRRMDVPSIDLLQFHWWDYGDDAYQDALGFLNDLRAEGKIKNIGLTNFDTERLRRILDAGIPVVSNQVQYSLIDRRPEVKMAALCQERGVSLLPYGVVCGGLLTERFLEQPEPGGRELNTASLRKYKQMVDAWGGWALFQELLRAVKSVAARHDVDMAAVGARYVLDQPAVAGVIIGVRLGVADHREATARVFGVELTLADIEAIDVVLAKCRDLYRLIGDCGDEYRR